MLLLSRAQAKWSSLRGRQFMSVTLTYYPIVFETAMGLDAPDFGILSASAKGR